MFTILLLAETFTDENILSVYRLMVFSYQVIDEDTLKEACEQHPLCVVSVLPHILDCQANCRNGYLDVLNKMGDKYKKKMWG